MTWDSLWSSGGDLVYLVVFLSLWLVLKWRRRW